MLERVFCGNWKARAKDVLYPGWGSSSLLTILRTELHLNIELLRKYRTA